MDWIYENPPHWDTHKQRIIGGAADGIFVLGPFEDGDVIPGEWWRVEEQGRVLGYGWMEYTWGDAEVLLAVDPDARTRGVGSFILDHLESEARSRGLNYMYNVVRQSHPKRESVHRWLEGRGFGQSKDDDRLMRRVRVREASGDTP